MARMRGRAALLGALAAALALALGAVVADAQVVVDPCLQNKKKACMRVDTCQWLGKKNGGCKTPSNICLGIQKKKVGGVNKRQRCNGNPACRCSKKRKCGACVANVMTPAPGPVEKPAPAPNTKYTTGAWCATYMNAKGMENPCMMYSDLNGKFNQISMGQMAKEVIEPWPPTADPPTKVPGTCAEGPVCPSGGAGTYTPLQKCGDKLTMDVKYVTLGGSGLGAPVDKPACPYTAELAMNSSTLRAMADAQGAQGVDLDLEACMYCPDVWTKTAENAHAATPPLKVQVTAFGSSAASWQPQDVQRGLQWLVENDDKWDSVALMLYGSKMNEAAPGGFDICCCNDGADMPTAASPCGNTYMYFKQWIDYSYNGKKIPPNKIILAMTATPGAGLQKFMIDFFQDIVVKEGLKGIAFWDGYKLQKDWVPSWPFTPLPSPPPKCPPEGSKCIK